MRQLFVIFVSLLMTGCTMANDGLLNITLFEAAITTSPIQINIEAGKTTQQSWIACTQDTLRVSIEWVQPNRGEKLLLWFDDGHNLSDVWPLDRSGTQNFQVTMQHDGAITLRVQSLYSDTLIQVRPELVSGMHNQTGQCDTIAIQASLPMAVLPPLANMVEYTATLEWHQPVDLDLSSTWGKIPLDWRFRSQGLSSLNRDQNYPCLMVNNLDPAETIVWKIPEGSTAPLVFEVTYHSACRELPAPPVEYTLTVQGRGQTWKLENCLIEPDALPHHYDINKLMVCQGSEFELEERS